MAKTTSLLTTSVVARMLGVSEGTVRDIAKRGELDFQTNSAGQKLFAPESVKRCAAKRKRASDKNNTAAA